MDQHSLSADGDKAERNHKDGLATGFGSEASQQNQAEAGNRDNKQTKNKREMPLGQRWNGSKPPLEIN